MSSMISWPSTPEWQAQSLLADEAHSEVRKHFVMTQFQQRKRDSQIPLTPPGQNVNATAERPAEPSTTFPSTPFPTHRRPPAGISAKWHNLGIAVDKGNVHRFLMPLSILNSHIFATFK